MVNKVASLGVRGFQSIPKLKDPSLLKAKAYINGKWIDANDKTTFSVRNPANNEQIALCPDMNRSDTKTAISAAYDAFKGFKKTVPRDRAIALRKWYDLMMENAEDLATILTLENGKPFEDALTEVKYASKFFLWFSEEAPRLYGEVIPASMAGNKIFSLREPIGVCGILTPWNFPAAMITRKVGAAIAAGCSVVIKPAGETPLSALALVELSERAGIPKGVVNCVTSGNHTADIGEEICTNSQISKVSFTGSTKVGKLLMAQCSSTLKKVSMELGGNAPFIVFDDADLDQAVAGAISSKFRGSGQTCVCANRIFVQKGIYSEFAKRFAEKVKDFKLGFGLDAGVTQGPLINAEAVKKVKLQLQSAIEKGAKVVTGGRSGIPSENFFEPTVLTEVTSDMVFQGEETFGPLAPLQKFDSEKEVVDLANDVSVGLAGYIYSKDTSRIWRVADALQVGMVGVNTGLVSDPVAPFGGIKESGFGREGSLHGINEYTVIKAVTIGGLGSELQE